MTYKPLKTSFTKNSFNFIQIKRVGDKAIFSKQKEGGGISYEVIMVQRHLDYQIAGVTIEAAETYPSSESWGVYGFTYVTLAEAEKKFKKLT